MKKIALIFLAFIGSFTLGFSQVIFSNEITDANPSTDNPYTNGQVVDANISVSGIGRGTGIGPNIGTDRYNARDWDSPALDLNDYFEFTLTSNATYEIDFISFEYVGQASPTGPSNIEIRSSLDGYSSAIGIPTINGSTIDLSGAQYQNINTSITFRLYSWNATSPTGTFSINDFAFNGTVSIIPCPTTATWDGVAWDNVIGPDATTGAIINGAYSTIATGSFTACNLEVNANLFIDNGDFVEVINDVTVNAGTLTTESRGSFVQRGNNFSIAGGDAVVIKTIVPNTEEDYTYWSSPVANITIADGLTDANPNRRYTFNANNYEDLDADGIDDLGNDWEPVTDTELMEAGKGYISMHGLFIFPLGVGEYDYLFEGEFNTGDITQAVPFNPVNTINHWNLLGNPYPSALDASTFFTANTGVVNSALFMWSQVSPPDGANPGNEVLNFNQADYITINSMGTAGNGTTPAPSSSVPSGQSFFISSISAGNVVFTNSMRLSGANLNDEFYRNNQENVYSDIERLWVNLSSDIGIYSQICIAYADSATDSYDGQGVDTDRNYAGNAGLLYSMDNANGGFYVIQGKSKSSLNENEIINIGFASYLSTSEIYSISLSDFEGEYLENNNIYLVDRDLGIVHDLKSSPYEFLSSGGDFANRFDIAFSENALSLSDNDNLVSAFNIVEKKDNFVEFSISTNSATFERIEVYDLNGRRVYDFEGKSNLEIFDFSNLKNQVFIAKAHLSNGQVITKKAIKQY